MVITSHGIEAIKVQFGDTALIFNPPSKSSKVGKNLRMAANVGLVSIDHPDMNGADSLSDKKDADIFIVDGPGEYEIGGVFIEGYQSKSQYGGEEKINTIYKVILEGMTIVYLGAINENNLDNNIMEAITSPDILFVPIGGDGVMNPAEASKFAVKLSPSLVVPIHFEGVGEKDALKKFLKEEGEEKPDKVDKLTVKKSDLLNKEGEVVVIESS